MIKITVAALVAAAMLTASSAFAEDKACCAKGTSKADSIACVNLATLNLTPDQKTKIEAWQAECTSRLHEREPADIPQTRQRILSAEQFAQLKAECKKSASAKKTEA